MIGYKTTLGKEGYELAEAFGMVMTERNTDQLDAVVMLSHFCNNEYDGCRYTRNDMNTLKEK